MDELVSLTKRVKAVRRQIKFWFLLDGISRLLIYILPYLFVVFWIDYLLRDLPVVPRLIFLAGAVVMVVFIFISRLIAPLLKFSRISDDALIVLIEKQFPVLGERLINLWQLSRAGVVKGALAEVLESETAERSKNLPFARILAPERSLSLFAAALVLAVAATTVVLWFPSEINVWAERLLGGTVKWPKRTELAFRVSPGDTVARYQSLSVFVWAKKGPQLDAAFIAVGRDMETSQLTAQPVKWLRMSRVERPTEQIQYRVFKYDFAQVLESFSFVIKGGDDQTEWFRVAVLDAPSLDRISVEYEFPSYTGWLPKIEPGGDIKAPRGTKARISGVCNLKLLSAVLKLESSSATGAGADIAVLPFSVAEFATPESLTGTFISAYINVEDDQKYSITLAATNGLRNAEPYEYFIKCMPDNFPAIKVAEPAEETRYVTSEALLPVRALVSDDYGLTDARIIVSVRYEGQPDFYRGRAGAGATSLLSPTVPAQADRYIPPVYSVVSFEATAYAKSFALADTLDIGLFKLKEGDLAILNVAATDNCRIPGYQTTTSADYALVIVSKPHLEKQIEQAILQLKDEIKKTAQIQESAMVTTDTRIAANNQRRVSQNSVNVSFALARVIEDVSANKLFTQDAHDKLNLVNNILKDVSNTKSPKALSALAEPEDSGLEKARKGQQDIKDDLDTALRTLEEWENYQDVVNSVQDLLADSKRIAEKMKEAGANSPDSLPPEGLEKEHLEAEAQNLAKEVSGLEQKMERVSRKLQESQPFYADKLRQGAEFVRADDLDRDLRTLNENLQSSRTGQAIKSAESVQSKLASLLNFLENRLDPNEVNKKIEELGKTLDKVDELKNEQKQIKEETLKSIDPTGSAAELAQALDSLLLDQKALNQATQTAQSGNEKDAQELLKRLAEPQEELKEQAEKIAKGLEQATPDNQAPNSKLEQAVENLRESAQDMNQASQAMREPNDSAGQPVNKNQENISHKQQDALRKLQQARQELKDFMNRTPTPEEKRKLERLAQRQKDLKDATEQAARDEEKQKQAQESLKSASKKMDQASQSLDNASPSDAQQKQQEAQDELDRLYETLAEQREALRQSQMQKNMAQLQEMLKTILDKQNAINDDTNEIFNQESEARATRENIIRAKKLSTEQGELADEANDVRRKLAEEESQVYSFNIDAINDDMRLSSRLLAEAADNLADASRGGYLREVQNDIAGRIKELLEALESEQNQRKSLQASGTQMKNRLLPLLSEIKMAKYMQENLKSRTEALRRELASKTNPEDVSVRQMLLQRMTAEQGHLAEMIRNIARKIEEEAKKEKHENDE